VASEELSGSHDLIRLGYAASQEKIEYSEFVYTRFTHPLLTPETFLQENPCDDSSPHYFAAP
jgi:hypothetical protein